MGQIPLWCRVSSPFLPTPAQSTPGFGARVNTARADGEGGRVGGCWDWEKRDIQGTGNNPKCTVSVIAAAPGEAGAVSLERSTGCQRKSS